MIYQINDYEVVIGFITVILFGVLELGIYIKLKDSLVIKFPLIAVIFLFALIININTIYLGIPTTPYFQIFFILFESIILIFSGFDYYEIKNKKS